eukprot:11062193-Alexandrium_andersonii.AAC.1
MQQLVDSGVAILLQLKADWAEIANTLGFKSWAAAHFPCFCCSSSHDTLHTMYDQISAVDLPWPVQGPGAYEAACRACELHVDVADEHT